MVGKWSGNGKDMVRKCEGHGGEMLGKWRGNGKDMVRKCSGIGREKTVPWKITRNCNTSSRARARALAKS